jgi:hypothetical protein
MPRSGYSRAGVQILLFLAGLPPAGQLSFTASASAYGKHDWIPGSRLIARGLDRA